MYNPFQNEDNFTIVDNFYCAGSSQMKKYLESCINNLNSITSSSLWKSKAVKLINYSDLTQYTLFI